MDTNQAIEQVLEGADEGAVLDLLMEKPLKDYSPEEQAAFTKGVHLTTAVGIGTHLAYKGAKAVYQKLKDRKQSKEQMHMNMHDRFHGHPENRYQGMQHHREDMPPLHYNVGGQHIPDHEQDMPMDGMRLAMHHYKQMDRSKVYPNVMHRSW